MKKGILIGIIFAAQNLFAGTINDQPWISFQKITEEVSTLAFDWKVGDTATYNVKTIVSGTMTMTITGLDASTLTIKQDLDLGFAGKQSCETKIDPNTGKTLSLVCNGQNQQLPDPTDVEIVDQKAEKVTVPAGTFDSVHYTIRKKSDNTEINQWINPKAVPVMGMIKSITPSQFGNVDVQLKSFKKY